MGRGGAESRGRPWNERDMRKENEKKGEKKPTLFPFSPSYLFKQRQYSKYFDTARSSSIQIKFCQLICIISISVEEVWGCSGL